MAALAALLSGCDDKGAQVAGDWPTYGGDGENHYSQLTQINDGNVAKLGLAWYHDIDLGGSSLTAPVAVDGVLYMAAGFSVVHAFEAATGKLLWTYDPESWKTAGHKLRAAWGSRGLTYADGQLFVATIEGRLIALDAKTGKPLWSVMTILPDDERYITGPPWVFDGKVIIGHGGADFAPIRGYVTAYDQKTGKQLWRFHTVPGNPADGFENKAMEMAAKTWTGEWWKFGGGGTAWHGMAWDPQFRRIYIGTGNGSPWNQRIRSPEGGDNLFLSSIVALDADTGEYIWHYQTNPGETWDYNAVMDMTLTDLEIDGKKRPVMITAPKNGFLYVIDRENGKLISAEKIVPVTWAERIDIATGRPVEAKNARFQPGTASIIYPSPYGAHSIEAMSFSPKTGLVYIPVMDQGRVFTDPAGPLNEWRHLGGQRLSPGVGAPPPGLQPRAPTSALLAWNPVTQKEAWRLPYPTMRGGGGTMATAGNLVMQGRTTGEFVALAADTGKTLWSFDAQTAVQAQPITYLANGKQYVSVVAGARFPGAVGLPREWNYLTQRWRLLTFSLDGKASLPAADNVDLPILDLPDFRIDRISADLGKTVYAQRCSICHGPNALSGGAAPDLLRSGVAADLESLSAVLREGQLQSRGMPRFEELTDAELKGLQHYLRTRAREVAAAPPVPTRIRHDEGQ